MRLYKRGGKWHVDLRWRYGRLRMAGYREKRATAELGRKLEALAAFREAGERPDRELSRWIEGLPPAMQESLAERGLLDPDRAASAKPLADHVADWQAHLRQKGDSERHVIREPRKVRAACEGAGCKTLGGLDAAKVERWIVRKREEDDWSARTVNSYVRAVKGFCKWLVKADRIGANPLERLSTVPQRHDRRRDRRALSTDDLLRLLAAAESGPAFRGTRGPEWALLFRLAAETGFRWSELRSLTRASFALDGDAPAVRLAGGEAKNRTDCIQPLRPDTAANLREHLRFKLPDAPAFALPRTDCGAKAVRFYLARTGDPDSGLAPIPYTDASGRTFDFHALRGQFATGLAKAGVSVQAARELMRHSTVDLTLTHYTHYTLEDRRGAIDRLADLSARPHTEAVAKTGTEDAKSCARIRAHSGTLSRNPVDRNGQTPYRKAAGAEGACAQETGPRGRFEAPPGPSESVPSAGFEPATWGLEVPCSVH